MSDEILTVIPATHGPDGSKTEPEQAPAIVSRPLESAGFVLPGSYDIETTAGEVAESMRRKCATCAHFNIPRWRKLRRELEWSSKREDREWVNTVRATIDEYMPDAERQRHLDVQTGDLDIEHALDAFGLCDAITEIRSKEENELYPVLVLADGGCPDSKSPMGTDLAQCYKPRDRTADRIGGQGYDRVLAMAQGKKP